MIGLGLLAGVRLSHEQQAFSLSGSHISLETNDIDFRPTSATIGLVSAAIAVLDGLVIGQQNPMSEKLTRERAIGTLYKLLMA